MLSPRRIMMPVFIAILLQTVDTSSLSIRWLKVTPTPENLIRSPLDLIQIILKDSPPKTIYAVSLRAASISEASPPFFVDGLYGNGPRLPNLNDLPPQFLDKRYWQDADIEIELDIQDLVGINESTFLVTQIDIISPTQFINALRSDLLHPEVLQDPIFDDETFNEDSLSDEENLEG